jgi:hypothetical protein
MIHVPFPEITERDAIIAALRDENTRLRHALDNSVALQSHYAGLLNMHDGGQRMVFADAEAWIARLDEPGVQSWIPKK